MGKKRKDGAIVGEETIVLRPIGVVRSPLERLMPFFNGEEMDESQRMAEIRRQHEAVQNVETEIVFLPELEEALEGLEDFSHVILLYWAHKIPPDRCRIMRIRPMGRRDMPELGVLSTCSPARPNPILSSLAKILRREGHVLWVRGLEALDGSPVLDIKPYVHDYHGTDESTVPQWMQQLRQDLWSS